MEQPYMVGKWHGLNNYQCPYCPFNTLDEAMAMQHYIDAHVPQREPPPGVHGMVLVADRHGRQVAMQMTEDDYASADTNQN